MKKIFLVFNLVCLSFFFAYLVSAQTSTSTNTNIGEDKSSSVTFTPNVDIPGFFEDTQKIDANSIATYINAVYRYGAGFAGIVAIFMIVFAAWQWIIAAGNSGKIENAKDTIISSLIGLALLFGGYLLLAQISSRLVELKGVNINPIESRRIGDQDDPCSNAADVASCEAIGQCAVQYKAYQESNGTDGGGIEVRKFGKCVNLCAESADEHACGENFTMSTVGKTFIGYLDDPENLPEGYFEFNENVNLKQQVSCSSGGQCDNNLRCISVQQPGLNCNYGEDCECQLETAGCPSDRLVENIINNPYLIVDAGDARVLPSVNQKLENAILLLTVGENLRITSAYRSMDEQTRLRMCYDQKNNTGICPQGCGNCNEASVPSCNASHQTGRAIDVCYIGNVNGAPINICGNYMSAVYNCRYAYNEAGNSMCSNIVKTAQNRLYSIMTNAGFSAISDEWWHFQTN